MSVSVSKREQQSASGWVSSTVRFGTIQYGSHMVDILAMMKPSVAMLSVDP